MKRDWKVAACLLAGVYLFSGLSPVGTSFDSRWSVYVAMSLWQHGDTNLDEYAQTIRNNDYYARFFSDLTPVFVLFLIPYFARWEKLSRVVRVALVACALVGLGMHLRGGWSTAVYEWNMKPVSVDQHPERNWDFRDPPFLR